MNVLSIFALMLVFQLEPQPDPIPNATLSGPITDAITARFEERFIRQEAEAKAMESRLIERFSERIAALTKELDDAKMERSSIANELKEWNHNRIGLMARMAECRSEITESLKKWTPLQNLVDRLTSLVWKLFWFVCIVCGMLILLGMFFLYMYSRMKGFVSHEIADVVKRFGGS
jgi:hypothetical protein